MNLSCSEVPVSEGDGKVRDWEGKLDAPFRSRENREWQRLNGRHVQALPSTGATKGARPGFHFELALAPQRIAWFPLPSVSWLDLSCPACPSSCKPALWGWGGGRAEPSWGEGTGSRSIQLAAAWEGGREGGRGVWTGGHHPVVSGETLSWMRRKPPFVRMLPRAGCRNDFYRFRAGWLLRRPPPKGSLRGGKRPSIRLSSTQLLLFAYVNICWSVSKSVLFSLSF